MKLQIRKNNRVVIISAALAVFIIITACFVIFGLRESGLRGMKKKAHYLSETGLDRAIWYLNTPVSAGGRGIKWRTEGTLEWFAPGSYYIIVKDGEAKGEVVVTSIGSIDSVSKTISQVLIQDQLPPAFDYAIFSNSSMRMSGNSKVLGDIYARGSVNIDFPSKVEEGYVNASLGFLVSGSGSYRVGGTGASYYFPDADYRFYSDSISAARTESNGIKSDKSYSDIDVSNDIYVDGDIEISGQIYGSGLVVAAKSIKIRNAIVHSAAKFIAGQNIEIENSTTSDRNSMFYADRSMYIKGNSSIKGTLMVRAGELVLDGNVYAAGLIFCGGDICRLKQKAKITGSVASKRIDLISDDITISHDTTSFPDMPPNGLAADILGRKPNSRSEW